MEKPIYEKVVGEKKLLVNKRPVPAMLIAEFYIDQSFDPKDSTWGEPEDRLQLQRDIDSGDAYPADLVLTAKIGEVEGTAVMGGFVVSSENDEEEVIKNALADYHLDQEALEDLVKSLNLHFDKLGIGDLVQAKLPATGTNKSTAISRPATDRGDKAERFSIDLGKIQPLGARVRVKEEYQRGGNEDRSGIATVIGHEWNPYYYYVDAILKFPQGHQLPFGPHEIERA